MTDPSEEFNKSADLRMGVARQDEAKLDSDQLDIFGTTKAQENAAEELAIVKLEADRPQRIADNATFLSAQRSLELGQTGGTQAPFRKEEVLSFYERAQKEGRTVEELAPRNSRENYIKIGISNTQVYEKQQADMRAEARYERERKLLDNLLSLDKSSEIKKDDGRKL